MCLIIVFNLVLNIISAYKIFASVIITGDNETCYATYQCVFIGYTRALQFKSNTFSMLFFSYVYSRMNTGHNDESTHTHK